MTFERELLDLFISGNIDNVKDRFSLIMHALKQYQFEIDTFFIFKRYFDLGIKFYDICQQEIEANCDKIEESRFIQYQTFLIKFKLHMLDYLDKWNEYIDFFNWALESVKIPLYYDVVESKHEGYIYTDSEGNHIHFLYSESNRYNIIKRKFNRLISGKSIDHLKHQQRDEIEESIGMFIKYN